MPSIDRRRGWGVMAALAVAVALIPFAVLLVETPWKHLGDLGAAAGPVAVTAAAGGVALAVVVGLGLPAAWYLARHASTPFRRVSEAAMVALLLMPPLVLGLVLAYLLGPDTPVGAWLLRLGVTPTNSFFALVVAQVYEAFPYFVLTAWAAFTTVPRVYEEAAANLRPHPLAVFREVTLPLAAPGLVAALAMAWARLVGAFGAVIVVAYHPVGLPVAIWIGLEETGLASALPLAVALLALGFPVPLALMVWRQSRDPLAG
ncbi:MAG: ABC transporter permease subunit [Firmicutes bacterium]|nr:ABC transporter permease subunit [Alicyclobacillaceae bacterium]MCL6497813.1 ABC transporter permease subunit [Bacillota bacterium]